MSKNSTKQYMEESLSALMDGEITALELRRLLKLDEEQFSELRERWLSYQIASSSLKNDMPAIAYQDISGQISAAIVDEPVHRGKKQTSGRLWAGVGRFAIAASVAGAVVLGVPFSPDNVTQQVADVEKPVEQVVPSHRVPRSFGHTMPQDTVVSTVSNENRPSESSKKEITITKDTQQKLQEAGSQVNRLMLEHAQNAAQNTQQGVLPYARLPESSETE